MNVEGAAVLRFFLSEKKIAINEKREAILAIFDRVFKESFTEEECKQSALPPVGSRDAVSWWKGTLQYVGITHTAEPIKFPILSLNLDQASFKIVETYQKRLIDFLCNKGGISTKEIQNETITRSKILIMEFLIRIVALALFFDFKSAHDGERLIAMLKVFLDELIKKSEALTVQKTELLGFGNVPALFGGYRTLSPFGLFLKEIHTDWINQIARIYHTEKLMHENKKCLLEATHLAQRRRDIIICRLIAALDSSQSIGRDNQTMPFILESCEKELISRAWVQQKGGVIRNAVKHVWNGGSVEEEYAEAMEGKNDIEKEKARTDLLKEGVDQFEKKEEKREAIHDLYAVLEEINQEINLLCGVGSTFDFCGWILILLGAININSIADICKKNTETEHELLKRIAPKKDSDFSDLIGTKISLPLSSTFDYKNLYPKETWRGVNESEVEKTISHFRSLGDEALLKEIVSLASNAYGRLLKSEAYFNVEIIDKQKIQRLQNLFHSPEKNQDSLENETKKSQRTDENSIAIYEQSLFHSAHGDEEKRDAFDLIIKDIQYQFCKGTACLIRMNALKILFDGVREWLIKKGIYQESWKTLVLGKSKYIDEKGIFHYQREIKPIQIKDADFKIVNEIENILRNLTRDERIEGEVTEALKKMSFEPGKNIAGLSDIIEAREDFNWMKEKGNIAFDKATKEIIKKYNKDIENFYSSLKKENTLFPLKEMLLHLYHSYCIAYYLAARLLSMNDLQNELDEAEDSRFSSFVTLSENLFLQSPVFMEKLSQYKENPYPVFLLMSLQQQQREEGQSDEDEEIKKDNIKQKQSYLTLFKDERNRNSYRKIDWGKKLYGMNDAMRKECIDDIICCQWNVMQLLRSELNEKEYSSKKALKEIQQLAETFSFGVDKDELQKKITSFASAIKNKRIFTPLNKPKNLFRLIVRSFSMVTTMPSVSNSMASLENKYREKEEQLMGHVLDLYKGRSNAFKNPSWSLYFRSFMLNYKNKYPELLADVDIELDLNSLHNPLCNEIKEMVGRRSGALNTRNIMDLVSSSEGSINEVKSILDSKRREGKERQKRMVVPGVPGRKSDKKNDGENNTNEEKSNTNENVTEGKMGMFNNFIKKKASEEKKPLFTQKPASSR